MKHYSVYGPYEVPTKRDGRGRRVVNSQAARLQSFWKHAGGNSREIGCYVFGMQHGDSFKPFYIGKTVRQRFERECFQPHKLKHYNEVLATDKGRRRPVLLLIRRTRHHGGRPARDIDRMETWLIMQAKSMNHRLKNKSKSVQMWGIAGVIRSDGGKSTPAARLLRHAVGIAS